MSAYNNGGHCGTVVVEQEQMYELDGHGEQPLHNSTSSPRLRKITLLFQESVTSNITELSLVGCDMKSTTFLQFITHNHTQLLDNGQVPSMHHRHQLPEHLRLFLRGYEIDPNSKLCDHGVLDGCIIIYTLRRANSDTISTHLQTIFNVLCISGLVLFGIMILSLYYPRYFTHFTNVVLFVFAILWLIAALFYGLSTYL
ncbi:hypothetical protein Pelo_1583 [Pelomyxa schiedti]|nr:hypothetical protein Pelo_1583 [Pelomyxa schiedti]